MSDFFADTVTVTTTSTSFFAPSEFDRRVFIDIPSTSTAVISTGVDLYIGFSNATGAKIDVSGGSPFDFVLPADEELFLYVVSGTAQVGLIVTKP